MAARVTSSYAEVLITAAPTNARVTTSYAEVLITSKDSVVRMYSNLNEVMVSDSPSDVRMYSCVVEVMSLLNFKQPFNTEALTLTPGHFNITQSSTDGIQFTTEPLTLSTQIFGIPVIISFNTEALTLTDQPFQVFENTTIQFNTEPLVITANDFDVYIPEPRDTDFMMDFQLWQ